jgi:ABC-type lipoprotein release transport system permease subunit
LPALGWRDGAIVAGALAISLVAAIGPSLGAYRVDPAQVLKAR